MTKLSKSNAAGIANARLHLRFGNPGAYTRSMAGLHRAASAAQQKAIWDAVLADEMQHNFTRTHNGTCLLAIEPVVEDAELTLLEMAA